MSTGRTHRPRPPGRGESRPPPRSDRAARTADPAVHGPPTRQCRPTRLGETQHRRAHSRRQAPRRSAWPRTAVRSARRNEPGCAGRADPNWLHSDIIPCRSGHGESCRRSLNRRPSMASHRSGPPHVGDQLVGLADAAGPPTPHSGSRGADCPDRAQPWQRNSEALAAVCSGCRRSARRADAGSEKEAMRARTGQWDRQPRPSRAHSCVEALARRESRLAHTECCPTS